MKKGSQILAAFSKLKPEAMRTAARMVHYCVESGVAMGQDEGILWPSNRRRSFRAQLEQFIRETETQ